MSTEKDPPSIESLIEDQRHFLHDIASPLMIAMGMTESVASQIGKGDAQQHKERLDKAKAALLKISEKLKANRTSLINLGKSLDHK